MTGRSSTRIHAPPGGGSSISLGGGGEAPARKSNRRDPNATREQAVSSNAFANGNNQNAGNVMTGRSSTRIHAPPGGGSSISLGGGGSAPKIRSGVRRVKPGAVPGAAGAVSSNKF